MNKDIAVKVSKHPLIKKLMELASPKLVARIIVEEVIKDEEIIKQTAQSFETSFKGLDVILSDKEAEDAEKNYEARYDNILQQYKLYSGEGQAELPGDILRKIEDKIKEYGQKYEEAFIDKKQPESKPKDIVKNVAEEVLATEEQISTALVIQTIDEKIENAIPTYQEYSGKIKNQARAKVVNKLLPVIQSEIPQSVTKDLEDFATQQAAPTPDKEKKVSPEFKPLEISEENKNNFIKAVNDLRDDFYKQRYKVDQGVLVNNVIDAIAAIAGEEERELSYQQVSDEEQVGGEEAINEEENSDLDIEEKEMRDLRASFRSFLNLVNKTKKALKDFEGQAEKGTIMSSGLKKAFMKLLARLQKSISLLVRAITNVVGEKQELQEATKEEILKQWKTVQKSYKNTLSLASALKELLEGEEEVKIDPEATLQDAYSSAIELSQYFPSVNPFGRTTGRKSDLKRYKEQFNAAITDVKDALQYVVNVVKRGAANKPALSDSVDALKEFSSQIKDIFGVEGPVSGEYRPQEQATQEEPESVEPTPTPVEDDGIDDEEAERIKQEFLDDVAGRQEMIRDSIRTLKMTTQPDEVDAMTLFIDALILELSEEQDTIAESMSQVMNLIKDDKTSKAVVRAYKGLDSKYKKLIDNVIGNNIEEFVTNILSITTAVMLGKTVEAATDVTGKDQKDNASKIIYAAIEDYADTIPGIAAKTAKKLEPAVGFDVLDTARELDMIEDPNIISYERKE